MNLDSTIVLFGSGTSEGVTKAWDTRGRGRKISFALRGLAAEAKKASTFEEFEHDFSADIKHGKYWHVTTDPKFAIDPAKGPRDASSIGDGSREAGKLMVTSDLENWTDFYGKSRPYAAEIDMSSVPRNAYHQVSRGFGNEFFVNDPSNAKVARVLPVKEAIKIDKQHQKALEDWIGGEDDLKNFYELARQ
jgi:hypothetical protein